MEKSDNSRKSPFLRRDSGFWIWYINTAKEAELDTNLIGKWMYFFWPEDHAFAEKLCLEAIEKGVVVEAKRNNEKYLIREKKMNGVICFYLNGNDIAAHKRVIRFFLSHGLVRRTKSDKLYNISFKFDAQTYAGEYSGSGFKGKIRLSDFINLETGEFLPEDPVIEL